MNQMKQTLTVNGKSVEITMYQSMQGDFIATANFVGYKGMAVSRAKDKKSAHKICLDRLVQLEDRLLIK